MPDYVVVTVKYGERTADVELPAKVPFHRWKEALHSVCGKAFGGKCLEAVEVQLLYGGIVIGDNVTLEECCIFDGTILEVKVGQR